MRSSDTVTFTNLSEGTEVELRADGGIVAATSLAQSNGIATFTLNHWPMESYYINGINYSVSGGIYGGDTFNLSKIITPVCTKNSISTALVSNASPSDVVITFANALNANIIPDISSFTLSGKTILSILISGAVVTITVTVAYIYSDSITVSYTRPQTNSLRSNPATTYIDSFTGQAITNNITIPLLYDTFTDTNGVHLHDHTMNVGSGWSVAESPNTNLTIQGNKVSNAGGTFNALVQAGVANFTASLKLTVPSVKYYVGRIAFRANANATQSFYFNLQNDNANTFYIGLYKEATLIGSTINITHVNGATYTLRVTTNGTSIKAYLDGVLKFDITNTNYQTNTLVGFLTYVAGNYQTCLFDDFIILP
jgi:hypothetical protein